MPTTSEAIATALDHHQAGRLNEAEQIYRQIIDADPNCVSAWNLLGVLAAQVSQFEVAVQCLENALRLKPDSAQIHFNMGSALQNQGKLREAIVSYRRAIQYDPGHARAHHNLGATLGQAMQLDPVVTESSGNRSDASDSYSHWDEARRCFERSIALQPELAEAHTNYGTSLLASGEFEKGWAEYEWRFKTNQSPWRQIDKPQWDGHPLQGRTILLHAEQGLGDTLQFIRYATLVKELSGIIIVECQKVLVPLLESCSGIDRLIAHGDELPPFDVHAPLLSLPGLLKTTVATVPAKVPYLFAEEPLIAHWREKLADLKGFRIGINWRGRPGKGMFRHRDIPAGCFASLAESPVAFVSLQKGAVPEELAAITDRPIYSPGEDFDESHGAFMDTAAIMKNLDLVITSDTSLPHVAGALGVPVWIALPFVASWQWMRDRSDSPWYPTARLFRQKTPGDWKGVFDEVRRVLRDQIGAQPFRSFPRASEA